MTAIAGRKVRIKYDADGEGVGAAVVIARAKSDSITINKEPIDITSKDNNGIRTLLNAIGGQSAELTVSGILDAGAQHRTLVGLAAASTDDAQLHTFEFDAPGVGVLRGVWFISSFQMGAEDGPDAATFEMTLMSSGAIAWTAAT